MKNLSFSILLFIVAFLLSGENQAQTDFRKGYIITTERDTIQGLIDYQSEIKNCKICVFKNDMDTQPLSLSPEDILAYRYNNEKLYVRKEINNDSITKLVFIEFIVNGIIDLFFYADISGSFYFIEEGNGTLNYLKIENKIASNLNNKNKNYYFNFKEYIGILKIVFKDNPELYPLIEHTKLNHQSLVKLLNKYHNINRSKENYELYVKKIQIVKIGLSLFTSLNSNKINVYEGKFDVPYEKEYYPTFGITADVMFPKFSNNFSLQLSGDIGKQITIIHIKKIIIIQI
ncbi:MAG: hypothetical protein HQ541_06230 [Mariniphaga sp.]|nr:hypothetical protein [Mariniphaga sp.]